MIDNLPAVIEFTDEKSEAVSERKPFVDWFKMQREAPSNTSIDEEGLKARHAAAHTRIDEATAYNVSAAPGDPVWTATRSIIQVAKDEIKKCEELASHFSFNL